MANIFKKPTSKVAPSYNGMDLSKSIKFTSSVGHLLPVLYDRLDPGDKVSIRTAIFTRTQPLNTAAFTRVTEHVDYFFVPMKMINSFFDNQFYGIQDMSSSLLFQNTAGSSMNLPTSSATGVPKTLPTLPLSVLTNTIQSNLDAVPTSPSTVDEFGVPAVFNFARLASLLGYSEYLTLGRHVDVQNPSSTDFVDNPSINLDYFFAYHRIFSDYYRLTTWESNNPFSYSEDYFLRYKEGTTLSALSQLPPFLNYTKNMNNGVVSFSHYNRNSPFTIRYRGWKKDYFTNVEPTPLYDLSNNIYRTNASGDKSAVLDINSILGTDTTAYGNQDLSSFEVVSDSDSSNVFLDPGNSQGVAISPVLLNILNAWQKTLGVTQRAKKHYNDQTLAHYGYKVPRGISDEVYFLGSHSSRLQISEVVSTATTGTGDNSSVLGEIAGKGISGNTNGRRIKFEAPCHGILMAIYSAVPESDYLATGIDRTNLYTNILHYYHPTLDRLGYQPLTLREYDIAQQGSSITPTLLGWSYRYSELKTKYDTIHGAFCHTLSNWVTPRDTSLIYKADSGSNGTVNSAGVLATYYINPHSIDPIMELYFLGGRDVQPDRPKKTSVTIGGKELPYYDASAIYATDPLLHNIDFQYYKSTKKSTYGMPNL